MYDFIIANLSETIFAKLTPFSWQNIKPTFTILWQGLLAIFAVIGIIIAVVWAINFCIARADNAKKEKLSKNESDENVENTNTETNGRTGGAKR